MTVFYILLGLVVAALVGAISIYNRLVRNRQMVQEGWSGIDVQLKRRADLIPNLIETVKGYMGQKRMLEKVTNPDPEPAARNIGEKGRARCFPPWASSWPWRRATRPEGLPELSGFTKIPGDIEDQIQLSRAITTARPGT
jgi:LemA protein